MDLNKRIERYHKFYQSGRPGDLLIAVRQGWLRKKNLFDYDFTRGGHLEMAADVIKGAQTLAAPNENLDDDFIPWVYPDFGIAIHHAYVIDVPVRMAEWTSWADHPLEGPDGYRRLDEVRFDRNNRWVKLVLEMLQYWVEHDDGTYLITGHPHYSPLDMANALRGNDIFLDYYDNPEKLSALLDRCTDTIIAFEQEHRKILGRQFAEVGVPLWGGLGPRNAVFLSEDLMDMSGPDISRQWGMPWTTRIRQAVGKIMVHHHAMGIKVQDVIGEEVKDSLIQVSNDPNYPPTMDTVEKFYADSGGNAIMIDASPTSIVENIHRLRNTRAILITSGPEADVRRAVEVVRENSNIG